MDRGAPTSWLVAGPGLEVVAADGVAVGTVRHVLAAPEEDIFDGLVIDLASGDTASSTPRTSTSSSSTPSCCGWTARKCEHLPEPQPAPGGLTATGDTPPPGPLQRKLHRAWDLISGNG